MLRYREKRILADLSCEAQILYVVAGTSASRVELTLLLPPSSVATWPKLAGELFSHRCRSREAKPPSPTTGLIEVLKHRDVFFVDSDVAFK